MWSPLAAIVAVAALLLALLLALPFSRDQRIGREVNKVLSASRRPEEVVGLCVSNTAEQKRAALAGLEVGISAANDVAAPQSRPRHEDHHDFCFEASVLLLQLQALHSHPPERAQ